MPMAAPIGSPPPEALGQRDDVRPDAGALVREPGSGAADPGLHLVDHQQRAVCGGDLAGRGEVAVGSRDHAGLAEDRLQEDRGHVSSTAARSASMSP